MQSYFETEMVKLRNRIVEMMNIVNSQIDKSFQVVFNPNTETIEIIKNDENRVDKLDIKIDKLCQRIFALAQPVASDLRFIMSSLRIGNELERIGDIAYDISKHAETVNQASELLQQFKLQEISRQVHQLFNQMIESYLNGNTEMASNIIATCRTVDFDCKNIFNQIVAEMTQKSNIIVVATDLILIMRNIERLLGHVANIAESVIFIVDAKIIKHAGLKQPDAQ